GTDCQSVLPGGALSNGGTDCQSVLLVGAPSVAPVLKVGIAWQGNPKHPGDPYRSVKLTQFAPLAAVPGVKLYSLQKGKGAEQLATLGSGKPAARAKDDPKRSEYTPLALGSRRELAEDSDLEKRDRHLADSEPVPFFEVVDLAGQLGPDFS